MAEQWAGSGPPLGEDNLRCCVVGRVISSIEGMEKGSEEVSIRFVDGGYLRLYHSPDCCESVTLTDFYGEDERGTVVSFEERSNDGSGDKEVSDSGTWTFYSIQTTTGEIWMRWLGESNGYYSESVATHVGNTDTVLVIDEGVPKLFVRVGEDHDAPHCLVANGHPGMSLEQMKQWIHMAAEVTKP